MPPQSPSPLSFHTHDIIHRPYFSSEDLGSGLFLSNIKLAVASVKGNQSCRWPIQVHRRRPQRANRISHSQISRIKMRLLAIRVLLFARCFPFSVFDDDSLVAHMSALFSIPAYQQLRVPSEVLNLDLGGNATPFSAPLSSSADAEYARYPSLSQPWCISFAHCQTRIRQPRRDSSPPPPELRPRYLCV